MTKPGFSQAPTVVIVPAAPRRRRWVTTALLVAGIVFAVLIALGVGGLAVMLAMNPGGPPFGGPVRLAAPLELAPVMSQSAAPCQPGLLTGDSGRTCYQTSPGMVVSQVKEISAGDVQVTLTLEKGDAEALARMTREAVDQPIAFIVHGRVIRTATVQEPITAGGLTISGLASEREARSLIDRLVGR